MSADKSKWARHNMIMFSERGNDELRKENNKVISVWK